MESWEEILSFKGTLAASGDRLLEGLQLFEQIGAWAEQKLVMTRAEYDLHPDSDAAYERYVKTERGCLEIQRQTSFVVQEIRDVEESVLERWLVVVPKLGAYRYYLQKVRERSLSQGMEEVLDGLEGVGAGYERAFFTLLSQDLPLPDEMTYAAALKGLGSADESERDAMYRSFYGALRRFAASFTSIYEGYVTQQATMAGLRGYPSARVAAADRDQVPEELWGRMIEQVRELMPFYHRYQEQRRKVLGVPRLKMSDLYTPLLQAAEPHLPLERVKELIVSAMAPLGVDYQTRLRALTDSVRTSPELTDAYAANVYNGRPQLLVPYEESFQGLFTLAHELGHGMHMMLANETQPYVYTDIPVFLSETAAVVHEMLLFRYLLRVTESAEERAALYDFELHQLRRLVFRGAMFTEFETALYDEVEAGGVLTSDFVAETFTALQQAYYGPSFEIDDLCMYDWVRVPQLFSAFYVCAYPLATFASSHLADAILNGRLPADDYLDFLRAGHSRPVPDLYASLGIELSGVELTASFQQLFTECIDSLERSCIIK